MTLAKFEATVRGDGVGKNDRVWFPKGKTNVSPTTSARGGLGFSSFFSAENSTSRWESTSFQYYFQINSHPNCQYGPRYH